MAAGTLFQVVNLARMRQFRDLRGRRGRFRSLLRGLLAATDKHQQNGKVEARGEDQTSGFSSHYNVLLGFLPVVNLIQRKCSLPIILVNKQKVSRPERPSDPQPGLIYVSSGYGIIRQMQENVTLALSITS
jgi:hypothetical protein